MVFNVEQEARLASFTAKWLADLTTSKARQRTSSILVGVESTSDAHRPAVDHLEDTTDVLGPRQGASNDKRRIGRDDHMGLPVVCGGHYTFDILALPVRVKAPRVRR